MLTVKCILKINNIYFFCTSFTHHNHIMILSTNKYTHLNSVIYYIIRKRKINLILNKKIIKINKGLRGDNSLAKKILKWKPKKNIFVAAGEIYNSNFLKS